MQWYSTWWLTDLSQAAYGQPNYGQYGASALYRDVWNTQDGARNNSGVAQQPAQPQWGAPSNSASFRPQDVRRWYGQLAAALPQLALAPTAQLAAPLTARSHATRTTR